MCMCEDTSEYPSGMRVCLSVCLFVNHGYAGHIRLLSGQCICLLQDCDALVETVVAKWGRVDVLVNNASALWWQDIVDTPMNNFDLITSINSRGTFALTKACLPHMKKNSFGR